MITIDPARKLTGDIDLSVKIELLEISSTRYYWKLPHERPVMARGPHPTMEAALADARAKCEAVMRKFKS